MEKALLLKKFIKQTGLVIDSVEDDSSATTPMLKVTLKESIKKVIGSNVIATGDPLFLNDVTTVHIATQAEIDKFTEGLEEDEHGTLVYKGAMKLDVSKPDGRYNGDKFEITKPAKCWLTSIAFNKSGGQLVQKRREGLGEALAKIFSAGEALAEATVNAGANATVNAAGAAPTKVVNPVNAPQQATKAGA